MQEEFGEGVRKLRGACGESLGRMQEEFGEGVGKLRGACREDMGGGSGEGVGSERGGCRDAGESFNTRSWTTHCQT